MSEISLSNNIFSIKHITVPFCLGVGDSTFTLCLRAILNSKVTTKSTEIWKIAINRAQKGNWFIVWDLKQGQVSPVWPHLGICTIGNSNIYFCPSAHLWEWQWNAMDIHFGIVDKFLVINTKPWIMRYFDLASIAINQINKVLLA